MDQIFNELSASSCYPTKKDAYLGMKNLAILIFKMQRAGFSRHMRTTQNFSQLLLCRDFTIRQWAIEKTNNIDRDLLRLILQSAGSTPHIEDLLNNDQEVIEYTYKDQRCLGLGLAARQKTGVLSLDGDKRFTQAFVEISYFRTDGLNDTSGTISVPSIYDESSCEQFIEWYRKALLKSIQPDEMVHNCANLFPCLRFNEQVKRQLRDMTGKEQFFHLLVEHLCKLNKAMEEWSAGFFLPQGLDWSNESQTTLQQYSDERTFLCDDGVERTFTSHTKLRGANLRIYFFAETEKRLVHIGYIGRHLRI